MRKKTNTIIDNDYNTLTVLDKDKKLLIRNINEYTLLKYKDFGGELIKVKLSDNVTVEETVNNEGVFNITVGKHKLQTRNKIEIAKRLKFCMTNKTTEPIIELLRDELTDEINKEFFRNALKPFGDRIEFLDDDSILIDDLFKVDKNGQAYVRKGKDDFKVICIVAGDPKFKHHINHSLGTFKIDFRTTEIYFKTLFLLFPDINDKVFYDQLPAQVKKRLKDK